MGGFVMTEAREKVWVVLCHPADVRNVGGAARSVANHGLAGLRVVTESNFDERDVFCYSSGGSDFIELEYHPTLDAAISDCQRVIGTSRRLRDPDAPPEWPSAGLGQRLKGDARTALLFGAERTGLLKEELDRCSAVVHVPTTETFPSMNLAHAVACLGYELARPDSSQAASFVTEESPILEASRRESFYAFVADTLDELGYPPGRSADSFVRRLRKILHRANLNQQELSMFGGIFSELRRVGRLAGLSGNQNKS